MILFRICVWIIIQNEINSEHLANKLHDSFFRTLVLHYCCGDNVKYGLLSKCLFQNQEHDGWKKCQGNKKTFLKNEMSFSSQMV